MLGKFLEKLIGPVFSVIEELVEDKDLQNELKMRVQMKLLENDAEITGYMRDVVVSETSGKGLKALWRPILMLVMTAIVANNYILMPYMSAIFNWSVVLDPPEQLWQLLNIGVGGYIVGRSGEKIADSLNNRPST